MKKTLIQILSIRMVLAETREELSVFESRRRGLCVVTAYPGGAWLVGRSVEGCPPRHPLYGCLLIENGFKTFLSDGHGTAFEKAHFVASEDSRQAASPSTIGSFSMGLVE